MTLRRFRRPAAERDIDDIWLHIAKDNVAAANALIFRIEDIESRLCDFPEIGQSRPELGPDLRYWPIGSYLLIYRAAGDRLEIVRIVHGARDLGGLFDEAD